jgi:hypothetical protein
MFGCLPGFIEVPVQSQEREQSYICVSGVSILSPFYNFRIVLTLWYFFVFHFVSFIEPLFFYSLGFFFIITFCIFFLNVTM